MGNAAHLLGIKPWQWDHLTVDEAEMLMDWTEEYVRRMEED